MSDLVAPLAIMGLVLAPLHIPVGVTIVHWIGNWSRPEAQPPGPPTA